MLTGTLSLAASLATSLSHGRSSWLVTLLAFVQAATNRNRRKIVRHYLHALGVPATFASIRSHLRDNIRTKLDRMIFLFGDHSTLSFQLHGTQRLAELHQRRQGTLILGAQLGCVEALDAALDVSDHKLYIIAKIPGVDRLNASLERRGRTQIRFVDAGNGGVDSLYNIQALLDAGEQVVILADTPKAGAQTEVEFLGAPAWFPNQIYMIANAVACPVLLCFGINTQGNQYDLHCELFAEQIKIPRKGRKDALRSYTQQYASRVEHFCRMHPSSWTNTTNLWSQRHAN